MATYRELIYANYGKNFQDASTEFDLAAARRWGRSCQYYFRGWLPSSHEASILDVACGGGKLLRFFVDAGYTKISGVDLSPDQVELSKQVVPDVYLENAVHFLESHRESFDLITGFDIIEHFHKDEVIRFITAAYCALRPGGRLILQTPNAESLWGSQHRYNDFTHEIGFNPNSIERLLHLAGFQEATSRECGPVAYGASFTSTIRWFFWQGIRGLLYAWNLIEMGSAGRGVFTRVFLVTARR